MEETLAAIDAFNLASDDRGSRVDDDRVVLKAKVKSIWKAVSPPPHVCHRSPFLFFFF